MALIGYGRVSTDEQNLSLQIDALTKKGCIKIFTDAGISGAQFARPGLKKALQSLRSGDVLVVWRLDRLGRSMTELLKLLEKLGKRQIKFMSLCEHLDTTSSGGMLIFHMMAALAEFERSLISERTRAGMAAARARGVLIGRKPSLTLEQRQHIRETVRLKNMCPASIAQEYNVHPRTIRRIIAKIEQA